MHEVNLFDKNMAILNGCSPELVAVIHSAETANHARILRSVAGPRTIQIRTEDRKEWFLHSPIDPVKEAEELVSDQEFGSQDATVLFGFGLGYVADEIVKRMPRGHDLFIVELRPDILKLALQQTDQSVLLQNRYVRLCCGIDSFEIIEKLKEVHSKVFSGSINKLIYAPVVRLLQDEYERIDRDIDRFVSGSQMQVGSYIRQLGMRVENLFKNLPALAGAQSAECLAGALTGEPCVVVASGPSLDGNIDQFQRIRGKISIIAVDGALRPLLQHDLVPDFVVTVDPIEANGRKVESIPKEHIAKTSLVFDPESNPDVVKAFVGQKYFVNTYNSLTNWLLGYLGDLPRFPAMLNVGHLGFNLARHLGCDPIILLGFDYAFPDDRGHATGTAKTWTWKPDDVPPLEIEDIYGKMVRTIPGFAAMVNLLEREIEKTDAVCIDATEGGARIRGTEVMRFADAIDRHNLTNRRQVVGSKKARRKEERIRAERRIRHAVRWLDSTCKEMSDRVAQAEVLLDKIRKESPDEMRYGERGGLNENLGKLRRLQQGICDNAEFMAIMADPLSAFHIHASRRTDRKTKTEKLHDEILMMEKFFEELRKILNSILDAVKTWDLDAGLRIRKRSN